MLGGALCDISDDVFSFSDDMLRNLVEPLDDYAIDDFSIYETAAISEKLDLLADILTSIFNLMFMSVVAVGILLCFLLVWRVIKVLL